MESKDQATAMITLSAHMVLTPNAKLAFTEDQHQLLLRRAWRNPLHSINMKACTFDNGGRKMACYRTIAAPLQPLYMQAAQSAAVNHQPEQLLCDSEMATLLMDQCPHSCVNTCRVLGHLPAYVPITLIIRPSSRGSTFFRLSTAHSNIQQASPLDRSAPPTTG
jgi:hypothetical protein